MTLRRRLVFTVLATVVLTGVFLMYTRPDFMVQMANQVWACF
nr:hypothetical protein [Rhodoferax sp.]